MSPQASRPGRTEVLAKLELARERLRSGRLAAAVPSRFRRELVALDWYTPEEISEGLDAVFSEVAPEHYNGRRPPEKSIEQECLGAELFPFDWNSGYVGERMYLKLAVNEKGSVWIVSLHRSTV